MDPTFAELVRIGDILDAALSTGIRSNFDPFRYLKENILRYAYEIAEDNHNDILKEKFSERSQLQVGTFKEIFKELTALDTFDNAETKLRINGVKRYIIGRAREIVSPHEALIHELDQLPRIPDQVAPVPVGGRRKKSRRRKRARKQMSKTKNIIKKK